MIVEAFIPGTEPAESARRRHEPMARWPAPAAAGLVVAAGTAGGRTGGIY